METFKLLGTFFAIVTLVCGVTGIFFILARWIKNELEKGIVVNVVSRRIKKNAFKKGALKTSVIRYVNLGDIKPKKSLKNLTDKYAHR